MYEQMSQSFEMQMSLGSQDSEIDDIKVVLPLSVQRLTPCRECFWKQARIYWALLWWYQFCIWLSTFWPLRMVCVTPAVGFVLCFVDIAFWKNTKSMEGLSVKTIVMNVVMQFIVFLYLLDNETSWMILLSVGIGLVIEIWKLRKAVDMEVLLEV